MKSNDFLTYNNIVIIKTFANNIENTFNFIFIFQNLISIYHIIKQEKIVEFSLRTITIVREKITQIQYIFNKSFYINVLLIQIIDIIFFNEYTICNLVRTRDFESNFFIICWRLINYYENSCNNCKWIDYNVKYTIIASLFLSFFSNNFFFQNQKEKWRF